MSHRAERVVPFPRERLGTVDYMRVASGRSDVHGLVEVDVTGARRTIDDLGAATGERPSVTAFLVRCLARAIDDHPGVNAYRDWRGRLVTFEDVDVSVLVETTVDGAHVGAPHVVRGADRRSLRSIHEEIRAAQRDPDLGRQPPLAALAMRLPAPVRRLVWRLPQWFPRRLKRLAGTVAVTSVGLFGSGAAGASARRTTRSSSRSAGSRRSRGSRTARTRAGGSNPGSTSASR